MPKQTLKQIATRVPLEVWELWQKHCKKQKQTSYEKLQNMIAEELGIDLERGWIIKSKENQELKKE